MGLENDCFLWDLKVNALASLAKMVDCSLTNYVVMCLIPVAVTQSFKFQMLYLFQAKVEGQAIAEWIFTLNVYVTWWKHTIRAFFLAAIYPVVFWIVTVIVIELCYLNCLILSLHFLGHALFSSFIIKTDFLMSLLILLWITRETFKKGYVNYFAKIYLQLN